MKHNCSTCHDKDHCALVDIAPWLDEHEDEIDRAKHDCVDSVTKVIEAFLDYYNLPTLAVSVLTAAFKRAFLIGYHKGRQFPSVPEVYNK